MTDGVKAKANDLTERVLVVLICASFFSLAIGTAPLTVCSLSVLAVWLFSGVCYRDRRDWLGESWVIPVLMLIALPWLGMLWSSSPVQKLAFAERTYYWLFALVAASSVRTEQALKRILICFIAGMAVTSLPILLYSFSILPEMYFMKRIATSGYITYSLLILIAIILLARLFRDSPDFRHKATICLFIALLLLTITQLNGRSAYLALVLLSPWIYITMFGRRRFMIIAASYLTVIVLLSLSTKVRERLALIPKEVNQYYAGVRPKVSAVGERLEMWNDASTIFLQHPVAGAGTAGYWFESNKMHPGRGASHPHSSYLFIAANYGILGLLLYGWLAILTVRRGLQARHTLQGHTILAFISVFMIGSLTDTTILSVASGIALGFIVGIPTPPSPECVS